MSNAEPLYVSSSKPGKMERWALVMVLLVATALRLINLPSRYNVRDTDEPLYLYGSLNVLEGITPGMKAAPAGPQTWIGWMYASAATIKNAILPDAQTRQVPLQVRPFFALQKTLFDLYHDTSSLRYFELAAFILVGLWSVIAAFHMGSKRGGPWVGAMAGALIAALPMFVDFSGMARPYSLGWSFGVLAVCHAAMPAGTFRWKWSAVLLGLAIASRVEMVMLLPAIWWLCWERGAQGRALVRQCLTVCGIAILTTVTAAPWLFTNIIGNLRTIATVRFAPASAVQTHTTPSLPAFFWEQGLAVAFLVFMAGILMGPAGSRGKRLVLAALVLALLAAMLKEDGYGIRHNGPTIIVFWFAATLGVGALQVRWPRVGPILVALVVALPLAQTIRLIIQNRDNALDGQLPVAWLESHIKPGATLYLSGDYIRVPLPTAASADALWQEVTGPDAWRRKFQAGLRRFNLGSLDIPRALSEENMIQERAARRSWFVLGGGPDAGPRYDIHVANSPVFGERDTAAAFAASGGVMVTTAPQACAMPFERWSSPSGKVECYVYYTPSALLNSGAPTPANTH